jgi:hypothetical protein
LEKEFSASAGHAFVFIPYLEGMKGAGNYFWRLAKGPAGMTVDASSGMVKWTPGIEHIGTISFELEVEELVDGNSADLRSTKSFVIHVYQPDDIRGVATNPYRIASKPGHDIGEGVPYRYRPIVWGPGGSLRFELLAGPKGMSIDEGTGLVSWDVPAGTRGVWVRFRAVADEEYVLEQDYYLFVKRADHVLKEESAPNTSSTGCSCSVVEL